MNIFAPNFEFRENSKTILCKFKMKVIGQRSRSREPKVYIFLYVLDYISAVYAPNLIKFGIKDALGLLNNNSESKRS